MAQVGGADGEPCVVLERGRGFPLSPPLHAMAFEALQLLEGLATLGQARGTEDPGVRERIGHLLGQEHRVAVDDRADQHAVRPRLGDAG